MAGYLIALIFLEALGHGVTANVLDEGRIGTMKNENGCDCGYN